MKLTQAAWDDYISRLSRLNQKAGQLMREYMDEHPEADTDALIRYAYAFVTKYGEGSAELACQMYDALAEAQGVTLPAAEPAPTATYGEVTGMVKATQDSPRSLQSGVSRMVKQAGADTTTRNAIRDGAEWAWVPHGDACPFCRMLASNGWQRASKNLLKKGHASTSTPTVTVSLRCGSAGSLTSPATTRKNTSGSTGRRAAISTTGGGLIMRPTGSASMPRNGRRMRLRRTEKTEAQSARYL